MKSSLPENYISNHQQHDSLFNRLHKLTTKLRTPGTLWSIINRWFSITNGQWCGKCSHVICCVFYNVHMKTSPRVPSLLILCGQHSMETRLFEIPSWVLSLQWEPHVTGKMFFIETEPCIRKAGICCILHVLAVWLYPWPLPPYVLPNGCNWQQRATLPTLPTAM